MIRSTYSRKHTLILAFSLFSRTLLPAQVSCYFNVGVFNTPQNQPFLETYLTFAGNSLAAREIDQKLQSSVNIVFTAFSDTMIVKANKYNLNGPLYSDTVSSPAFIDSQRYPLPNGSYRIKMVITDKYAPNQKPFVIEKTVQIAYTGKSIQCSNIEMLESFHKTEAPSLLSKSGYDLIPYTINYFPETAPSLSFYFESYNTDTVLGRGKSLLYVYYIEGPDGHRLEDFGDFKKQKTASVNPLLAKLDIRKLGSGNYNLVIELRDENNIMHLHQKFFFQRLNKEADAASQKEAWVNKPIKDYFYGYSSPDTLRMFVECLWPIASGVDKDRTINQSLRKDPQLMRNFIIDFWQRRAGDTADPVKIWAAYYKNVQEVMALFRCGKQPGYFTERGRVYLQYGKPNQRAQQPVDQNTYPYEIWQYYRIVDRANGAFFTNRKFVFVNKVMGDDCYKLVHSDMRGEINNDRWQFEVTRNSGNGADPNQATPSGSEINQLNEIYNNPR